MRSINTVNLNNFIYISFRNIFFLFNNQSGKMITEYRPDWREIEPQHKWREKYLYTQGSKYRICFFFEPLYFEFNVLNLSLQIKLIFNIFLHNSLLFIRSFMFVREMKRYKFHVAKVLKLNTLYKQTHLSLQCLARMRDMPVVTTQPLSGRVHRGEGGGVCDCGRTFAFYFWWSKCVIN